MVALPARLEVLQTLYLISLCNQPRLGYVRDLDPGAKIRADNQEISTEQVH